MSQNKTVVPGLEPEGSFQGGRVPFSPNVVAPQQNFYQRNAQQPLRGTVVPGMGQQGAAPAMGVQNMTEMQQPVQRMFNSGKPIVGFLYSVSRTAVGEFWPLHIGQNTIGQSSNSDICLAEGTVSIEHAVLVVRKMKNPEKVIASISDARSTNGTMLNGVSLGFAAVDCKNGDIITVGENYELYLILVDAPTLGLKVSENFIPVEVEQPDEEFVDPMVWNGGNLDTHPTRPGNIGDAGTPPPYAGMAGTNTAGGYVPQGGTVGLDGSVSYNDKGGTVAY